MKNRSLNSDLKTILTEPGNISKIRKGGISDFSIEIEFVMPATFSSYLYYGKKDNRDEDFQKLEELVSKK
jgi:hypothetical protein